MSTARSGGTDWPTPWRAPYAKGRVPIPAPEAVAAAPLLLALFTALDGAPSPCAGSPEVWTSTDEGDALVAAEHCHACPARQPCREYGEAIAATCGVFGGIDRTPRDGRPGRRRTDHTEMERSA